MQVKWSYEGLSFRHTTDEVDDPDCHGWQGPVDAAELIVHAANLHLFRFEGTALPLWSPAHATSYEEPKRVAA